MNNEKREPEMRNEKQQAKAEKRIALYYSLFICYAVTP